MSEIHPLIDEIRQSERELSSLATKRAKAVESAANASQAVQEIGDKLERLNLSERTIGEAGQRLSAMANRALARGLLQNEIQDALQPLALRDQIREASKIVTKAKDDSSNASLTLQRLASEAQAEVKAVELEFAAAEDALEALRDDLRILQAQPA